VGYVTDQTTGVNGENLIVVSIASLRIHRPNDRAASVAIPVISVQIAVCAVRTVNWFELRSTGRRTLRTGRRAKEVD
jgi:hypothetical protein